MRKRKAHIRFDSRTIVTITTPFKQRRFDLEKLNVKRAIPQEFGPPKIETVYTKYIDLVALKVVPSIDSCTLAASVGPLLDLDKDGNIYENGLCMYVMAKLSADTKISKVGHCMPGEFREYYKTGKDVFKGNEHTFEISIGD